MRISIGCDHAAFELKEKVKQYLSTKKNIELVQNFILLVAVVGAAKRRPAVQHCLPSIQFIKNNLQSSWVLGWVSRSGWGEARTTRRYWTELASFRTVEVRFQGGQLSGSDPVFNHFERVSAPFSRKIYLLHVLLMGTTVYF